MEKTIWKRNLVLVILAVVIAFLPLYLVNNSDFSGADGKAEETVAEIAPEYLPWAEPLLEPAGSEVESLLFALQAAVGSGIVFFILGRMTAGRRTVKKDGGNGYG